MNMDFLRSLASIVPPLKQGEASEAPHDDPPHRHQFIHWDIAVRGWRCVCGEVLSEAEAANKTRRDEAATRYLRKL